MTYLKHSPSLPGIAALALMAGVMVYWVSFIIRYL